MKIHTLLAAVLALTLGFAQTARAQATILQVQTQEDPSVPDDPAFCAQAGFPVNVRLNARVYAYHLDRRGEVSVRHERAIGTATACILLTSLSFPVGLAQNMYLRLDLPQGEVIALGQCTIQSNDVPQAGLVLAGCALRVLSAPAGYLGGQVSSASTFNPLQLPGYDTGSFWTVQLYDDPNAPPAHCHGDDDGD